MSLYERHKRRCRHRVSDQVTMEAETPVSSWEQRNAGSPRTWEKPGIKSFFLETWREHNLWPLGLGTTLHNCRRMILLFKDNTFVTQFYELFYVFAHLLSVCILCVCVWYIHTEYAMPYSFETGPPTGPGPWLASSHSNPHVSAPLLITRVTGMRIHILFLAWVRGIGIWTQVLMLT